MLGVEVSSCFVFDNASADAAGVSLIMCLIADTMSSASSASNNKAIERIRGAQILAWMTSGVCAKSSTAPSTQSLPTSATAGVTRPGVHVGGVAALASWNETHEPLLQSSPISEPVWHTAPDLGTGLAHRSAIVVTRRHEPTACDLHPQGSRVAVWGHAARDTRALHYNFLGAIVATSLVA